MNKNTDSKDFYILESVLLPGTYYKDNWKGFTTAASQAERYPSPEKDEYSAYIAKTSAY